MEQRHQVQKIATKSVYTVYMSALLEYPSVREGRDHLKDVLDAADAGRPAVIRRDQQKLAAVDAERLVRFLMSVRPAGVQAVAENGGWSLFIPGLPIAADGDTLENATAELIEALRDYAEAWVERLSHAPNHSDNWGLVQLISLATDDQLRQWIGK